MCFRYMGFTLAIATLLTACQPRTLRDAEREDTGDDDGNKTARRSRDRIPS